MDFYNRWLMRPSGEAKHQPQGAAEKAAATALDVIRRRGLLPADEAACVALANELVENMGNAIG
ncbi:MAG: hypothetical protein H7Y60_16895 [Rhodospirillaceae bacterium]|nr:hypothetical protein [Rhodospirillales bacterium]